MSYRNIILWTVAFLALGWVNLTIFQTERLIAEGEVIFLEIGPRDPRSLIQGDYMAMRYRLADNINVDSDLPSDGFLVIRLDERHIGHFVALYDGQSDLGADERLLSYRKRDRTIYLGPESFFFQEGQAEQYAEARYAEVRLPATGEIILVDLRGPELERLVQPEDERVNP
ncbi:MAG: GDYXXLXY domain-containing protein [Anaerolineae bacterium]|nr:GDYXXLXY domain-containing protein [Anaerolineae bacterium]